MAYTSLQQRLANLPLVICGPILRAVSPDSVTVWVALKERRMVWLRIHEYKELSPFPNLQNTLTTVLEGNGTTIAVGENLHIIAVTAKMPNGAQPLGPEKLYFYNLFFTDADNPPAAVSLADINLSTEGNTAPINFTIHYEHEPENPDPQHVNHVHLPSFSLPPDDLNSLRIVHGSCRKPNAEGLDAMPTIDRMIATDWKQPSGRPHFLFLTGDQIYADDVSPILLYMFIDAQKTFMGAGRQETFDSETITEKLEIEKEQETSEVEVTNVGATWKGILPPPRKRGPLLKHFAKFSDADFNNHLISFAEYCAIYLFVWSDVLWIKKTETDTGLPEFEDIYPNKERHYTLLYQDIARESPTKFFDQYTREVESLIKFESTLPQVRRALANIPTYMIFDDHDVTDDWFMTFNWCEKVLSNELGKRIVQNGMIAYTLFQGWGNNPAQFEAQKPGGKLLNIIGKKWIRGYFDAADADIAGPLGIPASTEKSDIFKIVNGENQLNAIDDIIEWHFHIIRSKFEIIALDGRTKRGYPVSGDPKARELWHASIICGEYVKKQIPVLVDKPELTIIISPTSIINIPAIDFDEFTFLGELLAKCKTKKDETLDVYDHWKNQSNTFEALLYHIATRGTKLDSNIVTRNLILTGDVHFCSASRLTYQNRRLVQDTDQTPANAVFAQLSSSSFKKQTSRTRLLHHNGYKFTTMTGLSFEKPGLYILFRLTLLDVVIFIIDRIANFIDSDSVYILEPKLPDPKEFLGWEGPADFGNLTQLKVGSQNILGKIYEAFAEANDYELDYTMVPVKPATVLTKGQALQVKDTVLPNPRWRYKTDYILAENEVREAFVTGEILDVGNPATPDKNQALKEYLKASKNHSEFTHKFGSGKEIVGMNNVSEISFDWQDGQEKFVEQKSWWYLNQKKENEPQLFFPLSKFRVSLQFKDADLPNLA